jgi:pimeloyl-ACP methyl ester carboxylesterase
MPTLFDQTASSMVLRRNGLRFTAYSAGQGPVALCLHGFPDNARSFRCQFPALVNAGYRVVAPTLRGYEQSSQPAGGDYGVEQLARDVIAWIDDLGEERVHLIGHDWGAVITYVAGARAPERFHSLTAIAIPHPARFTQVGIRKVPRQLLLSWYMMFFQLRGIAERAIRRSDWALIRRLWKTWSPGLDLPEAEWAALRETFEAPGVAEAMLGYYRANASPSALLGIADSALNRLAAIPVRTLVMTGADDGCIDTRLFDHAILPADFPAGVQLRRIQRAGHWVHQEKPAEVNSLILDWIGHR